MTNSTDTLDPIRGLLERLSPTDAWTTARTTLLKKSDGFAAHEAAYSACASTYANGPMPAWVPDANRSSNIGDAAAAVGYSSYEEFHAWSIANRADYWQLAANRLEIALDEPYSSVLTLASPTQPIWFADARMNIAKSCLQADDDLPAIVFASAGTSPGTVTYGELRARVAQIAHGLVDIGIQAGDAVAILMPMHPDAVAAYLAVISVGAAAVSIAESFSPSEIASRLKISNAVLVITQDVMSRAGKSIPLYQKAVEAGAPRAVVITTNPGSVDLRTGDAAWETFLGVDTRFDPVSRSPQDTVNILFSSGTTGEPKAIPWDHTTPIKCAADAHFHHDIHPSDVLCWPTSLGWMMGPWLVFAALLNRATIALYGDAPTTPEFGKFVQDARVTMLGLVPSIVRAWRATGAMEQWDWSAIRAFSSSGECSNSSDMLYLMYLADYKPVIEYCGGTEIGGAYITGTVVQPCTPAAFTTAALGLDFATFGDDFQPRNPGEVYLSGPSIGLSTRLLNRDHDSIYYAESVPSPSGVPWRKHGDEMESLLGGRYRMLGRCDDTMNLGGIKVSSIEIEQVLNRLPGVLETAAVAISPTGGGPSQLIVFAALRPGFEISASDLKPSMQQAIRSGLNPLFQISDIRLTDALPRTASNKIMRRELRDRLTKEFP